MGGRKLRNRDPALIPVFLSCLPGCTTLATQRDQPALSAQAPHSQHEGGPRQDHVRRPQPRIGISDRIGIHPGSVDPRSGIGIWPRNPDRNLRPGSSRTSIRASTPESGSKSAPRIGISFRSEAAAPDRPDRLGMSPAQVQPTSGRRASRGARDGAIAS